jgi:hypothetical protein
MECHTVGLLKCFFLTLASMLLPILIAYTPDAHGQDIRIPTGQHTDQAAHKAWADRLVGPEQTADNCASCHKLEAETWRHTRHALGFTDRHQSDRAKEVLKNMGQRSMKRGTLTNTCRSCHFTSVVNRDRLMPTWGVSCESCHAPAQDWNIVHSKTGGDMAAKTLEWGTGKTEAATQRMARLKAAKAQGMIYSEMLYELAANCLACHAVPDETLVNTGDHTAGSEEFDLVAWSQGEIRHNFVSSSGAPDAPTNRLASAENRRRLFVVGALADLEFSLRNLAGVKQPDVKSGTARQSYGHERSGEGR